MAACYRYVIVMNYIALTLRRRCQRAAFFGRSCRGRFVSHWDSFIADQRGAVAFETLIVWLFMMLSVLLPLADVAAAGFQFISAWEALRGFGQSIQYDKPDLTNASGWMSSKLAKADPRFPIQQFRLVCGDANLDCSPSNSASPQYYSYATTVTLSPMVLSAVLCTSSNANKCSFTLSYSEQMFQ
jgi:hypothetical protein